MEKRVFGGPAASFLGHLCFLQAKLISSDELTVSEQRVCVMLDFSAFGGGQREQEQPQASHVIA